MTGTVKTNGIEMDYCCFGHGARNLVILPGMSIKPLTPTAPAVEAAFSAFTDIFAVWLFDRRRNVTSHYSTEEMAADTLAAMKTLGIDEADFYGASQGGMIALVIALDAPECVGKMVLASSQARSNPFVSELMSGWKQLADAGKAEELSAAMTDAIYSETTLTAYRDTLLAANAGVSKEDLARVAVMMEAAIEFDVYGRIEELFKSAGCEPNTGAARDGRRPAEADSGKAELSRDILRNRTLVAGSEGDRVLLPVGTRELAEATGCELLMYGAEYGHGVYDEAPDFITKMLEFLLK